MGVEKDQLFAVMRSIISKRADQGFFTDTRQLRLLLEHGDMSAEAACSKDHLFYNRFWLNGDEAIKADQASGWVNPRGLIFWIDYAGHSTFSGAICGVYDPYILEKAGWLHVSDRRVDVVRRVTPRQAAIVEALMAAGFRCYGSDRLYDSVLASPEEDDRLSLRTYAGPIADYIWDDPKYWEERGIPRNAHNYATNSPAPEQAVRDWRADMRAAVYSESGRYNPYYAVHANQFDEYLSGRARELSAKAGVIV